MLNVKYKHNKNGGIKNWGKFQINKEEFAIARKARKDLNTPFLHIMVQGLNKEYIFNEENEIKKYLSLLSKNIQNLNVMIVSYCIMNNHAHILLYSEDVKEVSKLMRKVNTTYAIYYNEKHNRCGYVFRNRYKSEEIFTQSHLISCINYIHNNPVKAKMCELKKDYKYSSYNDYTQKTGFINDELIKKCFENNGLNYQDILKKDYECYKFIEDYDEIEEFEKKEIIENFIKENNISFNELQYNKIYLKKIVEILYLDYNVMQKEIAELLEINVSKIRRLINNKFKNN